MVAHEGMVESHGREGWTDHVTPFVDLILNFRIGVPVGCAMVRRSQD